MREISLTNVQERAIDISTKALVLHLLKHFRHIFPRKWIFWRDTTVTWVHKNIHTGYDRGLEIQHVHVTIKGTVTVGDNSFGVRLTTYFTDKVFDTKSVSVRLLNFGEGVSEWQEWRYVCGTDLPVLKKAA